MVIKMDLNKNDYKISRSSPINSTREYLETGPGRQKTKLKEKLLGMEYADLFMIQSSGKRWEALMNDPDVLFRRKLSPSLYNLNQIKLRFALGVSKGTANNVLNQSIVLDRRTAHKLAQIFNLPLQVVLEREPSELSYSALTGYHLVGSVKKVDLQNIYKERAQTDSVSAFLITNPQSLFERETESPVPGRWVTSYTGMDYFEFYLSHEPILDKSKIREILQMFPFAEHIITTYVPFRPDKRSLWVLGPKQSVEREYHTLLHELEEYRDKTVVYKVDR